MAKLTSQGEYCLQGLHMTDECINLPIDSRNGGRVRRDLTLENEDVARGLPAILGTRKKVIISTLVIVLHHTSRGQLKWNFKLTPSSMSNSE